MEGRDWRVVKVTPSRATSDVILYEGDRRLVLLAYSQQSLLEQIATEHNQHTTLVEQRDRYARALEVIRDSFWSEDEPAEERVEHLQQLATDALATVEQGHEEQTGGGSEG